ncbi:hypothetical protein HDU92_001426 [Lobulomyces angularis]|nr:hypothetical protein HDU92_001426 [Lobulomyces angularis]
MKEEEIIKIKLTIEKEKKKKINGLILTNLPIEILEKIFIFSSNESLSSTCITFYNISKSLVIKCNWLLHKYGKEKVLFHCWSWKFFKQVKVENKVFGSCYCLKKYRPASKLDDNKKKNTELNNNLERDEDLILNSKNFDLTYIQLKEKNKKKIKILDNEEEEDSKKKNLECLKNKENKISVSSRKKNYYSSSSSCSSSENESTACLIEKKQIKLIKYLLSKGAKLNAGNDMSLKMSAKFGHLNLTKFLLINGADPNAKVVLKKNWYNYFFSTRLYKLGGTLLNDDDNVDLNIGSSNPVGRINETRNNQTETNSPNVESFSNTPTSPTSNFNAPLLPNSETVSTANPQHNHILEASVLNKKKKVCQVDLLLQAVQGNHVHLVEILITPTKKNNSFDNNTVQIPIRTSSLSPTSSPTRIVNTEGSTSLSINIGHNEFSQDSQRVSSDTLQTALADAFLHNRLHMAKMLIKVGGAKSNSKMINNLLQKAGAWRLGCGVREKYTKLLVLCIQALTEETFQRLQHSIVRAVSEIGSVGALKASLERGGDINCWDGLPIYSAVYSGILGIYGGGIIVTSDPSDPNAGTSVSVAELSTMAVPAIAALVVMYRLVPFHRLLYSLILVCKEQSKRNRDRWLRLESPVPMNEVVVH